MSQTGDSHEFVLRLCDSPNGAPMGTLRAVGDLSEQPFEGWIGLIGLITELGFEAGDAHGESEGRTDSRNSRRDG